MRPEDSEELIALAKTNRETGKPSFIHKSLWRDQYQRLVQCGWVRWGSPPEGFDASRFAGVEITPLGQRAVLADAQSQREQ